ncbi:MAG TPA: YcnI family protein [Steroidobacteraceae bacterium]|nr:YcnI family protein [Steroidobacteraceae bacterium]
MYSVIVRTAVGVAATIFPLCTFAHVTAQPNVAPSGAEFIVTFVVPHGCDGFPTTALRIKVPEGVTAVKPQMKSGWSVTIKTRKLDHPLAIGRGRTISETVDEVDWRGGPLPDAFYDTFGLMMKLPDAPGQVLYFPAVQECQHGIHRWIQIPDSDHARHDLREPAPFIRLTGSAS